MHWTKMGLLYTPTGEWWAKTHGFVPTPEVIDDDTLRIYFSTRDEKCTSRIRYLEVDKIDLSKIQYITEKPILDVGSFSSFDESGVVPSCVLNVGDEKRLYYFGWQKTSTMGYLLLCGLAISRDAGKTFTRYSNVPLLERTDREPFLRSTASVIEDNGIFRMWHSSGIAWTEFNDKPCPSYIIRYAESRDGLSWASTDKICINLKNDDEFGIARPWVMKSGDIYKMWYSIRTKSKPYYIGYAESKDGIEWERLDNMVGLCTSNDGWDSEMICFNSVVNFGNKQYMFYNGNRHGIEGFGYAELEREA